MSTLQTVMFYDGGCPLCRREIAHYRKLDRAQRIDWVDITQDHHRLAALDIPVRQAMQRLHVQTPDGRLVTGAEAFATVWQELPYYRWLARIVRGARLLRPLDAAYRWFARRRFQRRCRNGACPIES